MVEFQKSNPKGYDSRRWKIHRLRYMQVNHQQGYYSEIKYVVEEELARQKVPQRGQEEEAEMFKEDSTPRQSNDV